MRMSLLKRFGLFIFIAAFIFSCNKKDSFDDTDFQKQRLTELMIPLQAGKYITYRVDSTVFLNFGRVTEIHKYQVKHVVDSLITDNLGRPSFRIFTYISDSAGTQPWQPNGSYFITVLDDQVEVIENNMRVIKIHTPVRDGNKWKGNTYLASDPYGSEYNFSNDDNMSDWDFYFDGGLQSSLRQADDLRGSPAGCGAADDRRPDRVRKRVRALPRPHGARRFGSQSGADDQGRERSARDRP